MYDVHSKNPEEFINHEEILNTLAYADENKNNSELIESLIEKAALRKGLLRQPNRPICAAVPVQLLY